MKTPMPSRTQEASTRSRAVSALPQALGLLGLIAGAPLSAASAQPVETGHLVGVHSGACLGRTSGPAALDCRSAPVISLVHMPGNPNRVMVRDESQNTCLFSNRDGRFGWYACTPQYEDQHWLFVVASAGAPIAAEGYQGKMLRAAHSGQCLFSNRDGRFGLYGCVAAYGDQFWRIEEPAGPRRERHRERPVEPVFEQPPPPPPPPPVVVMPRPRPVRDCGTGDDPGCQEQRDGFQAMGADVWTGFYANLRATASDLRKRDLVVTMAGSSYLTARQFVQVLTLFRSELLQIEVTQAVVSHVIDPQRALEFGARMRSGISRQQYIETLTASMPAPQHPGRR